MYLSTSGSPVRDDRIWSFVLSLRLAGRMDRVSLLRPVFSQAEPQLGQTIVLWNAEKYLKLLFGIFFGIIKQVFFNF